MKDTSELRDLLSAPKKIVITTHHKPDGDAIGSSLGLWHYLRKKGHEVIVITPNDYAPFLQWIPGNEQVLQFEESCKTAEGKLEIGKLVAEADYIFCLDFNRLYRINELGKLVGKSTAKKVLIDHHLEPDSFADYALTRIPSSSTAELIYDFITEKMQDAELLDQNIATALYVGIMTDTGSFRFNTTTPEVHRVIAHLLEFNINHASVHERIFNSFSENRLKFFGYCFQECMQVFPEYKTVLISVPYEKIVEYNITTGDTEGLVNYALSIAGTVFGALIVDRKEIIKMSFRSVDDFDVNTFANKHFDGGGHKNAAGGKSHASLKSTVTKFIELLPKYKDALLTAESGS